MVTKECWALCSYQWSCMSFAGIKECENSGLRHRRRAARRGQKRPTEQPVPESDLKLKTSEQHESQSFGRNTYFTYRHRFTHPRSLFWA